MYKITGVLIKQQRGGSKRKKRRMAESTSQDALASGGEEEEEEDPDFEELRPPEVDPLAELLDHDGEKCVIQGDGGDKMNVLPHGGTCFSFSRVHEPSCSLLTPNRLLTLPDCPIEVKIVNVERDHSSTHILYPNLYVIELRHGDFQWSIRRRYKHFQQLHQQLQMYRAAMSIPLPTKKHRERRRSYREDNARRPLPRFPKKPESLLSQEEVQQRAEQLEAYLSNLVMVPAYRMNPHTMQFLEVSHLSFVAGLGPKGREGLVYKRSGGHHSARGCVRLHFLFYQCCSRWRKRWLIAKDTCVLYVRPRDGVIKSVLLMDQGFQVQSGFMATGVNHGLLVTNLTRNLLVKCWTKRKEREWKDHLQELAKTTGRDFTHPNRYDAFAPIRTASHCRWYIDGSKYCEAVAHAIDLAKEEIFIADWWLTPEIYLKRPVVPNNRWRLDQLLQKKAEEGVKVFVLLYKEVEMALNINSLYSKQKLVAMHPNIKVLRHPDHVTGGILLWAHHEKLVVVDQKFAFLGGLDLCYGRWDDFNHRLTDVGGIQMQRQISKSEQPEVNTSMNEVANRLLASHRLRRQQSGGDGALNEGYGSIDAADGGGDLTPPAGATDTDTRNRGRRSLAGGRLSTGAAASGGAVYVDQEEGRVVVGDDGSSRIASNLMRARRVFRAVTVPVVLEAAAIATIANQQKKRRSTLLHMGMQAFHRHNRMGSLDSLNNLCDVPRSELRASSLEDDLGLQGSAKYWLGKDYTNFIFKDLTEVDNPFVDIVDRNVTPRMPWHDIGAAVSGAAARDIARHFVQRWNFTKFEKAKQHENYPWLLPKSYQDVELESTLPETAIGTLFTADCQILRSASNWSTGIKAVESSIHSAYIDNIVNAKHYIYIENQFFITLEQGNPTVENQIGEALFQRILKAHRNKQNFRVYVVMPLLPAFEGEVGTDTGVAIQAITHWNYASMCRGDSSILERLKAADVPDPTKYIDFFGLRKHDELHGKLTQELVYVHSKLMIVDDEVTIIGSANINDRSLLGRRDSELAVVVHDTEREKSIMDGRIYSAGRFAGSLRRSLFREHLGLLEGDGSTNGIDIRDPVASSFYDGVWRTTARRNAQIFEKVFRCIPSDSVRTFAGLREFTAIPGLAETDPDQARNELREVRGHLVDMPMDFLAEESLTPAAGTKEALMPIVLWT
ncbi:phospholipase D isoform X1 [Rhipicephalus microplus]|uniref:phospholipase D isoform X1 n=2 Tax=Rhipicephalus microplus TaxID=6941 RepID=UPI003F6BDF8D